MFGLVLGIAATSIDLFSANVSTESIFDLS